MNLNERWEELASLYVLGALEGPELREFEAELQSNPDLERFVAALGKSVEAVAGAVPVVTPPPHLRAKILAQIEPQRQNTLVLPERPWANAFFWWRVWATGLAALALVLFLQNGNLRQTINTQTQDINNLHQLAQTLQSATNDLTQTVLALQESNLTANLRITMLNSLIADAPKTVAVTLWDARKQGGVFVVENLKAIPADRDYEIWVMDEHKVPVAAGVFHMDASGTTRIDFKATRAIQTAGQFCVTEEVKGGVASPTLANLVLASN
jgi:anti-sigma-K factor RskA